MAVGCRRLREKPPALRVRAFGTLRLYPWLLTPGALVALAVLAFDVVGGALRDVADVRGN